MQPFVVFESHRQRLEKPAEQFSVTRREWSPGLGDQHEDAERVLAGVQRACEHVGADRGGQDRSQPFALVAGSGIGHVVRGAATWKTSARSRLAAGACGPGVNAPRLVPQATVSTILLPASARRTTTARRPRDRPGPARRPSSRLRFPYDGRLPARRPARGRAQRRNPRACAASGVGNNDAISPGNRMPPSYLRDENHQIAMKIEF